MTDAKPIYPVILSGGAGTRLWPLSREHYPKQLLKLLGDETLLQQTLRRADGIRGAANPVVICNEEHRFLISEQILQTSRRPETIILEPTGRNTCPAITLAALALSKTQPDALMLVMPADHVIADASAFRSSVEAAYPIAVSGRLVTFGVVPTAANTGYGYIRRGDEHSVAEFVEKPDAATAQRYVASRNYLWNGGIFLMSINTWLQEVRKWAPLISEACAAAVKQARVDGDFLRIDSACFAQCPSDSIDYAVMEKTDRAAVVPLDAGWSDVGAWSALWNICPHDGNGNVTFGDVYAVDTHDTLLLAQSRLVATVGLKDAIVIETPDAVLVVDRNRSEDVKAVVERLRVHQRSERLNHRKVHRPWGHYEGVDAGDRFQVKRLTIKPQASLSLQMHHHRAEHWVVVKGTAKVTRGEESFLLAENQSTYIPTGVRHRLENPGLIPLEIIEVQSGSYLGEDDIVRFADIYDRKTH